MRNSDSQRDEESLAILSVAKNLELHMRNSDSQRDEESDANLLNLLRTDSSFVAKQRRLSQNGKGAILSAAKNLELHMRHSESRRDEESDSKLFSFVRFRFFGRHKKQ